MEPDGKLRIYEMTMVGGAPQGWEVYPEQTQEWLAGAALMAVMKRVDCVVERDKGAGVWRVTSKRPGNSAAFELPGSDWRYGALAAQLRQSLGSLGLPNKRNSHGLTVSLINSAQ